MDEHLPADLSALEYAEGYYIAGNGDTVMTYIARCERCDEVFLITKNAAGDHSVVTPLQVRGYGVEGKEFASYEPPRKDQNRIYMFLLREISGKIEMYRTPVLPFHDAYNSNYDYRGSFHLVKKKGYSEYHELNLSSSGYTMTVDGRRSIRRGNNNDMAGPRYGPNGTSMVSPVTVMKSEDPNLDNSFKEIMSILVRDCEMVANKIKTDFYSKTDIIRVITEYNACE